jgi:D-glycero-alpha-D-manno-heptose-7-phosphate kinase
MIITRTPYRVSMFGGGTDHPKWFNENSGSVVSFSIDKYSYITLRELPPFFSHKFRVAYSKVETTDSAEQILHPAVKGAFIKYAGEFKLELHHHGDLPAQSGVGSSSAFAVGLIKSLYAINGKDIDSYRLADEAIFFEQRDLLETVGSQDQIACAVGGINHIEFNSNNKWKINKINLDSEYIKDLESRIVLIYSGIPRFSSDISKGLLDKLETKSELMIRTKNLADEFNKLLMIEGDLSLVSEMLKESWSIKKDLNPFSITPELDNFYQSALLKGAKAGKVLGAGGGGFFLFWVDPENRASFIKKMAPLVYVPISISFEGSTRIL